MRASCTATTHVREEFTDDVTQHRRRGVLGVASAVGPAPHDPGGQMQRRRAAVFTGAAFAVDTVWLR